MNTFCSFSGPFFRSCMLPPFSPFHLYPLSPPACFCLIQLFIHQYISSLLVHSGFIPSVFSSSSLHPCPPISSSASPGPCLSKECFHNRMLLNNSGHYANLSFIQRIKKIEKASFVRVRTNLHWAMRTRDERHLSRYIYIVFLFLHLHQCGIF